MRSTRLFRLAVRRRAFAVTAAILACAAAGLGASPAGAIPADTGDPDDIPRCISDLELVSLTADARQIALGQSTTIRWRVRAPGTCPDLTLKLDGTRVNLEGSRLVSPATSGVHTLRASWAGKFTRQLGTISIAVTLPPVVTIDRDDQTSLLRQALRTKDTMVRVLDGVQLNLTGLEDIIIAEGVSLIGGRSARQPGGLLYTKQRPGRLFLIDGDRVRISGLRIYGPDMGIADHDAAKSSAIRTNSNVDVQISGNELAGWSSSSVSVADEHDRIYWHLNRDTVRISDNFIHHNQRTRHSGYGVVVGSGAYARIERNVFDYNRHAIAGDGSHYSGYTAERNLVLQHGGRHRKIARVWFHTHQFDMHGQRNCGTQDIFSDSAFNCGIAGYQTEIRENSFLYTHKPAIKLRGTPQVEKVGMMVVSNVFAHSKIGKAVQQTETGLYLEDNRVGTNGMKRLGSCDFDADGVADRFMATGRTWWYASRNGHWVYLNSSRLMLAQLTLRDVNNDGRCDVSSGGAVSSGGTGPLS